MYDPTIGRWLTEDPIGFAAGDANLYRYAGNGQTNARDPSGMEIRFVPRGSSPQDMGHLLVLHPKGRYVGYLISIGGVPHVMRNGIAIALVKIIAEEDRWFGPASSEEWGQFISSNGFAHDEHEICLFRNDVDIQNTTNGRALNRADNVLGIWGDRRDAGMQAAILVVAMAKSVGGGLAIEVAGSLIPFGKFVEFALDKGFAVVRQGSKWVLVNVKTGVKVAGKDADELLADAAKALATSRRHIQITPGRRRHILDGDATGGGHRPGRSIPGKSEFPPGWSDDQIIDAILEVARDIGSDLKPGHGGRWVIEGARNGVRIRVIVECDGSIVTGFPIGALASP